METNDTPSPAPASLQQLRARVSGRVQGVGFRYYALSQAESLGLTGWVRNRPDGSVEVLAEGSRPELEAFVDALWKGPSGASVRNVHVEWSPASGTFERFQVTFFGF